MYFDRSTFLARNLYLIIRFWSSSSALRGTAADLNTGRLLFASSDAGAPVDFTATDRTVAGLLESAESDALSEAMNFLTTSGWLDAYAFEVMYTTVGTPGSAVEATESRSESPSALPAAMKGSEATAPATLPDLTAASIDGSDMTTNFIHRGRIAARFIDRGLGRKLKVAS